MADQTRKKIKHQSKQGKFANDKNKIGFSWKRALVSILIFTALIYVSALFNGFAGLDDEAYVTNNLLIKDFSLNGVKAIFSSYVTGNYHPLTMLTFLFEYKLFGADPFPYHLLNVLLHLLNTWLVFKLADSLSGKKITALVVALLFAVHPMHVNLCKNYFIIFYC